MSSRAQASSDYIMVYVWIIIIIATIASIFFVVLNKNFSCSSSDPRIIVESYSLPYSANYVSKTCSDNSCESWGELFTDDVSGKMSLVNATGGEISVVSIEPASQSFSSEKKPECIFAQLFVPNYINGKNYNQVNGGQPIKTPAGGKIAISSLSLSRDAIGQGCSVTDFSYPEKYSFSLAYEDNAKNRKKIAITCEGLPPKT